MIHIHTFSDECTIKDLIWGIEKDQSTHEEVKKEKPKFVRSGAKLLCRISSNRPIPLEKVTEMPTLGRFTLRDEGKTIAVGRVMKYKPYKDAIKPSASAQDVANKLAETKISAKYGNQEASTAGDIVFNLETGKTEA